MPAKTPRSIALLFLLTTCLLSNAWAVEDKYTQSSTCNAANTEWTVTTTCTKTVGGGIKNLQGGVQYAPAGAGMPTVTITDTNGNPIVVGGGSVLDMVASDEERLEAESTYGTLSPDHVWAGFRSDAQVEDPEPAGSVVYVVTYTWPTPVQATGAVWFSSTLDETAGNTVIDAYTLLPEPAPVPLNSRGTLALMMLGLVASGAFFVRRRHLARI